MVHTIIPCMHIWSHFLHSEWKLKPNLDSDTFVYDSEQFPKKQKQGNKGYAGK